MLKLGKMIKAVESLSSNEKWTVEELLKVTSKLDDYIEKYRDVKDKKNEPFRTKVRIFAIYKFWDIISYWRTLYLVITFLFIIIGVLDYIFFGSVVIDTIKEFFLFLVSNKWVTRMLVVIAFLWVSYVALKYKAIVGMLNINDEKYANYETKKKYLEFLYDSLLPLVDDPRNSYLET
ncbi:hypothetical protein JOC48_003216 [Aquibacillus albus]|uniref:Uncharacterized protein n=1 Tax=Aquibacillus albus TaxID=1168171 RepID=A0ABS2N470_9BACI|nr:hypothetical protein [Aquibacillus albus]